MNKVMYFSVLIFALWVVPTGSSASVVKNACMSSSAKTKSRSLCTCIQAAADATLNNRDQRKTAKMIGDPDLSQQIKASDSWSNERCWDRYTKFSELAQKFCS